MKTQIKIILLLLVGTFLSHSCVELDLLDNPNGLTADQTDVTTVLTGAQISFMSVSSGRVDNNSPGLNDASMEMMRMINQFGAYTGPFSNARAASSDDLWTAAYTGVLYPCNILIDQLEGTETQNVHLGIAKMLKAFTLMLLVDYYRDVPYTEAIQGDLGNFNPVADLGEDIYPEALTLIDGAIEAFNTGAPISNPIDLFFNSNRTAWVKAANQLKLRWYVQQQLITDYTTQIQAIIDGGSFIDEPGDDWIFQYSSITSPDSRHPIYINNYGAGGGADYMSNGLMDFMYNSKSVADPRMRYFFYRQTDDDPSGDDLPCADSGHPICYIGDAYWGRDHADDDGVPPDGGDRTLMGVYPIGGTFDDDAFQSAPDNTGAEGAGIFPIWLSSWTKFVAAEFALSPNFSSTLTATDARDFLEEGIRENIASVMEYAELFLGPNYADPSFIPTEDDIDDYVADALDNYDAATSDRERLDVVMQEFRVALYGNGIEAYNAYRRSGLPSNYQTPVYEAGNFPKSWLYPGISVERNTNISQVLVTEEVFWGCHPDVQ